jgi:hypothetical protein
MTFAIWGDEIAYDHQVIGRLTIGATTLRDRVEGDLLALDPDTDLLAEAAEEAA